MKNTARAPRPTLANIAATRILALAAVLTLNGCQLLGGLHLEEVAHSADRSGQVAVYASVTHGDVGLHSLEASNFRVYEDGKALPAETVQLQLLDRDTVAQHHALILLDLSGQIDTPGRRSLLAKQLTSFVERLRAQQDVSVYGFDGGPQLYPFGKFSKTGSGQDTTAAVHAKLESLAAHKQVDSSSNLNGAVLTAIAQLDYHLKQSRNPLRLGSLIVIARGQDLAGRTTEDRVEEVLDQSRHHFFALTMSGEANEELAERIGTHGHSQASSFDNMESGLAEVASKVEQDYSQYYLVSYCSPARAGKRTLLLEVQRPQSDGDPLTDSIEVEFNADGFSSACDASRTPHFSGPRATPQPAKPKESTAHATESSEPQEPDATEQSPTTPAPQPSSTASEGIAPPPSDSGYAP